MCVSERMSDSTIILIRYLFNVLMYMDLIFSFTDDHYRPIFFTHKE